MTIDLSIIPEGWYLQLLQEEHLHSYKHHGGWSSVRRGWRCELQANPYGGSLVSNVNNWLKSGWTETPQEALELAVKEVLEGIEQRRWSWVPR